MLVALKAVLVVSLVFALAAAVIAIREIIADARERKAAYIKGRRETYELIKELSAKHERIGEQPRRSFVKEALATQDWTGQVYKVK